MDNGGEVTQKPSIAGEVRDRRLLAFSLMIVAALFSGVVIGVMAMTYLSEENQPQDSPILKVLRTLLEKNPDSREIKETIREEDRKLRDTYFTYRRRMEVGAYLLLVGLIAVVLCAKWYVALDPKLPMPRSIAERSDTDEWIKMRRRNLMAIGAVGGVLGVGFLIMIVLGGSQFPRLEVPTIAARREKQGTKSPKGSQGKSAAQTKPLGVQSKPQPVNASFKESWPRFRGPSGTGIVKAGDWPNKWDEATGENILWKIKVPAPGKSSPIVWGNRIFLTGGDAEKREVFCFDRSKGNLIWRTVIKSPPKNKATGEELEVMEDTGYAAPTPATDGKRVYVTYATADIAAVSFDGKIIWIRNMGKPENTYGMATSLLVYKNLVIFQIDRGASADDNLSAILGIDTQTGKTVWRTPRPVPSSWSTPIVAEAETRHELITCANPWVIAYDPESGRELWRAKVLSGDVAPSPISINGIAFVTNEYAQTAAIRLGGSGDVTKTHIVWTADEGMSDASSPICNGHYLLQAHSSGIVTCYDALGGKLLWQQEFDCEFWASPTLVGKNVYLPGNNGKMYIFELAEKYQLLSTGDVAEPIFASPAFVDSRIYIRGKKHLFCIGKPK